MGRWQDGTGWSEISQIVPLQSRVKHVLTKLYGGPLGGHLVVAKSSDKVRQQYYWLQARRNIDGRCWQYNTYMASPSPRTRGQDLMHQCNIRVPFKRVAIDVSGPFP